MANEPTEPTAAEPTNQDPQGSEPQGTEPKAIDWKAMSRKWEDRAKENKEAADKLKEAEEKLKQIEDAQLSELEKAQKLAVEAKAEADTLKAEIARNEALKEAAKTEGVDMELLSLMAGTTSEEIAANAKLLKAKTAELPAYPSVTDNGAGGTSAITKDEIDKIKDPVARIKKRAEHPELYI